MVGILFPPNVVVWPFGAAKNYGLMLESHPMRALLDLPAFLYFHHFLTHPVNLFQHDGSAAHSSHEREHQRFLLAFVESRANFRVQHAAAAHASETHVGLNHPNHFELAQHFPNTVRRIRPDRPQPHHTHLHATVAHMLNRKLRSYRMGALQEEHHVRPVGHILLNPRIVLSSEYLRELLVHLLDHRHGFFHRARPLQLQRRTLLRHDLRPV